jgi:hypothetical protein
MANPNPASPLFSSVLAVQFSAAMEMRTTGVTLSLADHHALKAGQTLIRADAQPGRMTIELIADFSDYAQVKPTRWSWQIVSPPRPAWCSIARATTS